MYPKTLMTLAASVALWVAPAARGNVPTLPFPPPPPSSSAALAGQLAHQLFADAEALPDRPFELAITIAGAPARGETGRLSAHLADTVEAALRARARLGARVAVGGAERVSLAVTVEAGAISATARRTSLPTNVWQRLRYPGGRVVATAFATRPLDLELRTLLGLGRREVRLDRLRVVPVTHRSAALDRGPVLDLRVTDLDGDSAPELAILQPRAVTLLAWADGGFSRPLGRFDLTVLPPNPARVRQPIGRLVEVTRPDGSRLLAAASSDRATLALLALAGGALTPTPVTAPAGWPLYASGVDAWVAAPWPSGDDVLDGALREVRPGDAPPVELGAAQGLYDVRAFGVRGAASPGWDPHLGASAVDGTVSIWSSAAPEPLLLDGVGTAFAVADLDGDGVVEVLTTGDGLGPRDRLVLQGAASGGAPRRHWSGVTSAPVTAASWGDVDRDGYREVVIATWDGRAAELVIVVPRT